MACTSTSTTAGRSGTARRSCTSRTPRRRRAGAAARSGGNHRAIARSAAPLAAGHDPAKLVCFHNVDDDGGPDLMSFHGGEELITIRRHPDDGRSGDSRNVSRADAKASWSSPGKSRCAHSATGGGRGSRTRRSGPNPGRGRLLILFRAYAQRPRSLGRSAHSPLFGIVGLRPAALSTSLHGAHSLAPERRADILERARNDQCRNKGSSYDHLYCA